MTINMHFHFQNKINMSYLDIMCDDVNKITNKIVAHGVQSSE